MNWEILAVFEEKSNEILSILRRQNSRFRRKKHPVRDALKQGTSKPDDANVGCALRNDCTIFPRGNALVLTCWFIWSNLADHPKWHGKAVRTWTYWQFTVWEVRFSAQS